MVARTPQLGAVVASRYEIIRLVGRGGMGVVYEARDRILNETVALKILEGGLDAPAQLRRFREEIKLARRVSHWNVCRIHDYGETDGFPYISMELVEGTDLKRLLLDRGRLDEATAYDVVLQIAEGLAAIHRAGIVHRDLKPANIMRDRSGRVRLMDFGIAKSFEGSASGETGTIGLVGTPEYMSPEQARGERLDVRSDVYAFGIVVYEIFAGFAPFRGNAPIDVIVKHLQEPPLLDGSISQVMAPALREVLRRALAKGPSDRFATIADMANALREARSTPAPVTGATAPTLPSSVLVPLPESTTQKARRRDRTSPEVPPRPRGRSTAIRWLAGTIAAVGVVAAVQGLRGPPNTARLANVAASPAAVVPRLTSVSPSSSPSPDGRRARPDELPSASRVPRASDRAANDARGPESNTAPEVDEPPVEPVSGVTLTVGTTLLVRIHGQLRSDRVRPGDEFDASLEEALPLQGHELLPQGTPVKGRVEAVSPPRTPPWMTLSLIRIAVGGRAFAIRTTKYRLVAPAREGSPNLAAVVVGALAGSGLGAVLGGRDGALRGAAAGSAAGAALGRPRSSAGEEFVYANRLPFKLVEPAALGGSLVTFERSQR